MADGMGAYPRQEASIPCICEPAQQTERAGTLELGSGPLRDLGPYGAG